ncbi:hypothetical protein C5S53_03845 [Methanophagales archaeon]|jgi:hypothetical protein|nr:hypothetical protein C5S53_03845 [Methanophagales archaeon]
MVDRLYRVIQKGLIDVVVIMVMCMTKPIDGSTNMKACEVVRSMYVTEILEP